MNNPNINVAALKQDADRLTAEIEIRKRQREALRMVIDMYSDSEDAQVALGNNLADALGQPAPGQDPETPESLASYTTDLSNLSVNFTGTTNMFERLCRIGRVAEGRLLNLTKVSKFLLDSGESTADLRNLRNSVYSCLKGHPEHFEKVGTGNYLYHDSPRTTGLNDCDNDSVVVQTQSSNELL